MDILLNGEKEVLDKEYTVTGLIKKLEFNPDVVTVSVNGSILLKEDFDTTWVRSGDSVDILLFMGGGK